jgi:hypothetical protein
MAVSLRQNDVGPNKTSADAILPKGHGALALSRWLTSLRAGLLFEVRATDPVTFVAIAVLLLVIALPACYLSARKAMKVDPLVAPHYEQRGKLCLSVK